MLTFYGGIQFATTAKAHGLQIGHEMVVHPVVQKSPRANRCKQLVWPAGRRLVAKALSVPGALSQITQVF